MNMRKWGVVFLVAALMVALGLLAVACGEEETTTTMAPETTTTMAPETTTTMAPETTTTMAETTTTMAPAAAPIPWNEAIDHEGETGTVTGPVVAVVDKGAGIDKVLVFLGSEEDGFVAMFNYADLDKFGGLDGLNALMGKTILVTGEIYMNQFELKAEIEVKDPSQLAMAAPTAVIDWKLAMDFEGQTATVTGPVGAVVDKGAGIDKVLVFLGSEDDGFIAMINYADLDKFGGLDGLNALLDNWINVTGEIYVNQFELKGEIEVKDPAQIVGVVHWSAAMDLEGETATVAGDVGAVVDKGAGIDKVLVFLGSEDDGFIAMINYADLDKFGGLDALNALVGKKVQVTGEIYMNQFELKGEIEVKDPAQLMMVME